MDKKTYYVAVASGEILEPEDMNGNFEFEILANEEDIDQLQELFEEQAEAHDDTAARAMIPIREYHNDKENDAADYWLREIYRKLHALGTPETKQHIESMNILN
ncbi:hypothetical protein ACFQ88_10595 [Paenibacillus sp. NPDC056579]|uniref:hypothetical protein n=1 Tax=unclassified Paenibacillus TaxID=185978 RepID=UPI001EF8FE6B|nr:hypothetical protein [Paenibacillus sp. H1-7]ULL14695.1 hypothetical protein DVH26_09665 [Paenibacillus sp. H1-7]